MNETRLDGKRILLTQANVMMGPVFRTVLAEQGATVLTDDRVLDDPDLPAAVVAPADYQPAAPEIAEPPPADAVPADPEISDDQPDDSDDGTP